MTSEPVGESPNHCSLTNTLSSTAHFLLFLLPFFLFTATFGSCLPSCRPNSLQQCISVSHLQKTKQTKLPAPHPNNLSPPPKQPLPASKRQEEHATEGFLALNTLTQAWDLRLKHLKTHVRLWSKFIPAEWGLTKALMAFLPSKLKTFPQKYQARTSSNFHFHFSFQSERILSSSLGVRAACHSSKHLQPHTRKKTQKPSATLASSSTYPSSSCSLIF